MVKFSPPSENSGVEPDGSWMMVPLNGFNFVSLLEGKNLKLKYNKHYIKVEDVPDARPNIRILKVSGLKYGESELQVGNIKINVSVKKLKQISLAFNIVRIESTAKVTASDISALKEMVNHANNILTPQANIMILHNHPIKCVIVKDNNIRQISPDFRGRGLPEDTWDNIVKQGHKLPGVTNVFFVMSVQISRMKGIVNNSLGLTYNNNIMIPAKGCMMPFARTLAHEVIHALGFDSSHHTKPGTLMGSVMRSTRCTPTSESMRLPKSLVNKFNP